MPRLVNLCADLFQSGVREWQKVFLLSACINCFGGLTFLFLGSGEEQSWSNALPSHKVAPSDVQDDNDLQQQGK